MTLPAIPRCAYSLHTHAGTQIQDFYTAEQMLAFQRETVEACAKVCETAVCTDHAKINAIGDAAHYMECANQIRSLK